MKAPMGGTVLEFKVKPGDTVKKGDVVLVYEAMKMENNLTSDREGTIAALLIEEGEVMATDQPIIEFGAVKGGAKPAAKPAAAPKPAPAPAAKPAAAPAPKAEAKGVNPVDINKALSPVEGGTAAKSVLPTGRKENTPTLKLAEGTTLEINVSPDGGISIRITTGK
ncbi:MAG: acetyl-CoA carboxylase biotin carboxyl carrier protein subunit [Muribaculaceae bacterium]|nr:acetyl-CoA carboxylase biotin carboxyl carrier protein subunit [Bacteroidales bacterium]MDY2733729.1 acetyl-CoA carboxylase biotin carboxyl carrier protein subunit [Muribaculaceae bacterium]